MADKCTHCGAKPVQAIAVSRDDMYKTVELIDSVSTRLKLLIDNANDVRDEDLKPLAKAFDAATVAYTYLAQARKAAVEAYAALNVRPT